MPADILIYAIVAAGLVFWLRSILGTRREDEPQRPNPFAMKPDSTPVEGVKKPLAALAVPAPVTGDSLRQGLDRHMSITGGSATDSGLLDIARADTSFELPHFLRGAQDVFIMIVEAFAAGDRATLQKFLSPEVYTAFNTVLNERQTRGESASVEIHAVRQLQVMEARLEKRTAFVTVRFVASETNILRDKGGALLSGHPDRVTETVDIWTFRRDVKSRDPSWFVCETRDEDAAESAHKTVPDTK